MYKWLKDTLLESWLQPYPSNPLPFKCKLCCPDSLLSCAAGKSYLEIHAKMHDLEVENKENEVADNIDYDAANININNYLGNFILPERLTPENRTKVAELQFASSIAQTRIKFRQCEKDLKFFKTGQDRAVLQGVRMSRTKIANVVKNALNSYEKERYVRSLLNCKFSLHIDEVTEPLQRKTWMT